MIRAKLFISTLFVLALAAVAFAQETAQKPNLVRGEVVSIDLGKIIFRADDGTTVEATVTDKTTYTRVPPENPTQRVPSALSEIGPGDKIVASGFLSADKRSIPARTIYLMSKSDIALRQQKERDDWRARGTVGRVSKVDVAAKTITLAQRGFGADRLTVVKPADNAIFLRYAPDSVEIAKALPGNLAEIQVNDEIRVLGNRSADGAEIAAERIITGAFRTSTGKIKSIDVAKNELVVTDLATKKDIVVAIGEGSVLRQFPQADAERLAQLQVMMAMGGMMRPGGGGQGGGQPNGQGGGQVRPGQGGGQPNGQPNGQMPGGGGGMGGGMRQGGGGGAIDDSRFPTIKIADLKVGDDIGVMSTRTADTTRVKAIKLFSGIEPFIKASEAIASRPGGGGGRGEGGGGGASLSIPGLDGGFGGN